MGTATRVCITAKFPKREARPEDQTYLCFEETTPPWDQADLFFVRDGSDRNWFCHTSPIELTQQACQAFAEQVKEEYTPRNKKSLQRRLHNPLIIQVVLCRAATLDELRELLGAVKLQRPSREAAP